MEKLKKYNFPRPHFLATDNWINAEKTANKKTEQPGFLTSVLEG